MKWTPRQLMLPVLIGMSLTGVSLGILYLLVEKDKDKSKDDRTTKTVRSRNYVTIEVKVPREFVPAIIGRGGSVIKGIENNSSSRINFADDNTDLEHRICYIKGSSESVKMAEVMIKSLVASQPLVETYETYIPQRICPKIIGHGGETINRIQMSSGAKVLLERSWSHDPNSKRRVIIKGTTEQIATALTQIEDKVHEYTETLEKLVAGESSRLPRGKVTPRVLAVDPGPENPLLVQPSDEQALHEGTMEVYVSAIETPSQFWVQVAGTGTLSLDALIVDMTTYYEEKENRELHTLKNVTVGQTVAAKFAFDGKWYRGEVTSILEDTECTVYFLDYGDQEIVALKDVLELRTDFLSLRLQAIECTLANVKPRDEEWSEEACDRFRDLAWVAQWKVLIAKVRGFKERALGRGSSRREGSSIPCVDLYDKNDKKDINIGKQLVAENFAQAQEGAWSAASSTLSLSKRSNEDSMSPVPVRSAPPPPIATPPTPENPKQNINRKVTEEVDLTTPRKSKEIEEVDLVTPVKTSTLQFIAAEKSENLVNGGGDADTHLPYRNGDSGKENGNSDRMETSISDIRPAGCESDEESGDSDGFSLG